MPSPRWQASLHPLCAVVRQPLHHVQTRAVCDVLASLHAADDPSAAASLLLAVSATGRGRGRLRPEV